MFTPFKNVIMQPDFMSRLILLLLVCLQAHTAWAAETRVNLRGVRLSIFTPGISQQQHIIDVATMQLGTPYRYGGKSPNTGFDCSGLVQYVYQTAIQKQLPRTSRQLSRAGTPVFKQQLQPGDLVFFNTNGKPYSHVGIYLSNQKFIHAPRTGKNVQIEHLNQPYWAKRYQSAKRLLPH